ncbi:MAG: patatin-like phospholipase family protein [Gemmatimonadales bacterium]|nr:MAG: patatin-like phospholipase family protein [Gemmatimonadales bacterium]
MSRVRILSIDGGGVRGIIPAMVLAELEERSGRRVPELFDLVAGTSTGGILALGLTCPDPAEPTRARYRARDMVELYDVHAATIFHRSALRRLPGAELLEERYSADGLVRLLEEYFGPARLKDALTRVLLTAYELERRTAFFFKSWKAARDPDYDFSLVDVARATAAAPTYFEPHRIDAGNDYFSLVDGGVFANNPAMCALAEAFRGAAEGEVPEVVLLSLGTGELTRRIRHEDATGFGLARWARPIISVMMDGVSDSVRYQCDQILGANHFRFQARLDEGADDLDDASRENMRALRLLGERMIHAEPAKMDRLIEALVR